MVAVSKMLQQEAAPSRLSGVLDITGMEFLQDESFTAHCAAAAL